MDQLNIFEVLHQNYKITRPIRLIECFAGIGSQAKALKRLGVKFEHHKVIEFDKYAIASYNAVHGTNFEVSDITKIHAKDLEVVHTGLLTYLLTYSFPCQDLSKAGKGKGMKKGSGTRSGLLWEIERILDECDELPQVLLMENVPDVIGKKNIKQFQKWQAKLEKLGYSNYVAVLNSKDYGIPQNRNRCFMISILGNYNYNFPKPFELKLRLKDMLEYDVDEFYYLSKKQIDKMMLNTKCVEMLKTLNDFECFDFRYDEGIRGRVEKGICPTLTCKSGTGGISGQAMVKEPNITNNLVIGSTQKHAYIGSTNEISPSLTSAMGTGGGHIPMIVGGVAIPEATKKGYTIACDGDYVNLSYMDSTTRRGRVGKGCSQTLLCNDNNGVVTENPRIRKLTPLECWRLMGFDDEDFRNAEKVNSNSQLYKQAGNSIVVDVLVEIFRQLF